MVRWSERKELGGMGCLRILFRICPHWLLCLIAVPVSFCYWLFFPEGRRVARRYLSRLGKRGTWLCFYAFSLTLIEKVEGWAGRCSSADLLFFDDDLPQLRARLREGKGAMLFVSHLGNAELMRSLATEEQMGLKRKVRILSFIYFRGTAQFNAMLKQINPQSMVSLVDASHITVETMSLVQEVLDEVGLVVIAGDRTNVSGSGRSFSFPFLGTKARFPFGAFYLAALVGVPTYSVCFVREKDFLWRHRYEMHVWANPEIDSSSRKRRVEGAEKVAACFVSHLQEECRRHPYQWGNFYDFWEEGI